MCALWNTGYSVDFSLSWAPLVRVFTLLLPSGGCKQPSRWMLLWQGSLPIKGPVAMAWEIQQSMKWLEEALGIGTKTGPGVCNKELTFEMLIPLPDLFREGSRARWQVGLSSLPMCWDPQKSPLPATPTPYSCVSGAPIWKDNIFFWGRCPTSKALCQLFPKSKCSQHSLSPSLRAPPPSILLLPTFSRNCLSDNVGMFPFLISPLDASFQRRKHLLILIIFIPFAWHVGDA